MRVDGGGGVVKIMGSEELGGEMGEGGGGLANRGTAKWRRRCGRQRPLLPRSLGRKPNSDSEHVRQNPPGDLIIKGGFAWLLLALIFPLSRRWMDVGLPKVGRDRWFLLAQRLRRMENEQAAKQNHLQKTAQK